MSGTSPFPPGCEGTPQAGTAFPDSEVEPFIAADLANPAHLIGVWQQDRFSNGGARGLLGSVTFDGGRTWTTTSAPLSRCTGGNASNGGDYERASDPWVAIAADGSAAYQLGLGISRAGAGASAMVVSRSLDGGLTWNAAVTLARDEGCAFLVDKGSITADPREALLAYAVWDRLSDQCVVNSPNVTGPAWFTRTVDGGATWEAARKIYDPGVDSQTIGHQIAMLPDGTLLNAMLLIVGASSAASRIDVAVLRSVDKGATWPEPPIVVGQALNTAMRDAKTGRFVRTGGPLPGIAVDASTGAAYLAWEDARFSGFARNGIALSSSTDRGATWSQPVQVNQAPGSPAFTPAIAAAPGTVAVGYYDLRSDVPSDTARLLASYWMAASRDGGKTWQETALAGPFDLHTAPVTVAGREQFYFLGDYQGLIWDGSSFAAFFVATNTGNLADRTSVLLRRAPPP